MHSLDDQELAKVVVLLLLYWMCRVCKMLDLQPSQAGRFVCRFLQYTAHTVPLLICFAGGD